jgi:hypothetical protein
MGSDPKDDEEAWGDQIDDADAPSAGTSKEIFRKARSLNPQLAAQGSTTELFNKMKQGAAQKASAAANPAGPQVDLDELFERTKAGFVEARKKIEAEIARLQKEHAQIPISTLDTIMDALIEIDPNMTSPQTQEILKSEAQFLNQIGFTVRKVMDRKKVKRK